MSASSPTTTEAKTPLLSDKLYNGLKKFTTLVLPAASTLYFALAQIWGLPKAEEITGSVAALITALGALLHISSVSYNNSDTLNGKYVGDLVVEPHPTNPNDRVIVAHLNGDVSSVASLDEATFKVQTNPSE